jgi:two-component system OmpR family sensor kinase
MKLVLRVSMAIFLFITVSSIAIGYFAISKYHSSQINLVDASLDSKVKALKATKEDPLTVAQYLAQVSSIPVTVEYLALGGTITELTEIGPAVPKIPAQVLLLNARKSEVNFGTDLRIRTYPLAHNESLLFAESLTSINSDVAVLTKDLILFIILIDLLAGIVAFLVFRRDGKLNQVSHLIAAQQVAMQKFLGDASHELRTPLTVIKGYIELASSTSDTKKQKGYLGKSSKEIMRMETIINDLLFLAEAGEAQEETLEEVNLTAMVRDHIEVLGALQPNRAIESKVDSGIVVQANGKLIDRLIGNLFSNIRRHTAESAPVRVALRIQEKEIVLMIEDGGVGLAEYPERPRLLKRFAAQRSNEGGGSGLGLSIVSSIVERYHGALSLSKSELSGLKVEIRFPEDFLIHQS